MDAIYVQFRDETEEAIVAMFSCPQDEDFYPNQGQVFPDDPRWALYYDAQPAMMKPYLPAPY